MGKKSSGIMGYLYLIGMALVAIGFCLPMFKGGLGSASGFKFLDFDNFGFVTIGGLLIFIGGVLGVVLCFVKTKNSKLLKLVALAASIVGGIILVIGFNDSWLGKLVGKGFLKHAYIGFYMIIVGWVVGICGYLTEK